MIVSPGFGNRGVTETISTLSDPMTRIRGAMAEKGFLDCMSEAGCVFGLRWEDAKSGGRE